MHVLGLGFFLNFSYVGKLCMLEVSKEIFLNLSV